MRTQRGAEHPPLCSAEVVNGLYLCPLPQSACIGMSRVDLYLLHTYLYYVYIDDDNDDEDFDTYLANCVYTTTETIVFVEGKRTFVSVLLEGDMMVG